MTLKNIVLVLCLFTGSIVSGFNNDSGMRNSMLLSDSVKSGLSLFHNIEIIEYCILLPLKEFKEDFNDEFAVKAKHTFVPVNNADVNEYIDVQGFIIDRQNSNNVKYFYNDDITGIEESGLAIDTAYIDTVRNYYVIKGYLPNFIYKKFISVSWIYDSKITLNVGISENSNSLLWKRRIEEIIDRGVICH